MRKGKNADVKPHKVTVRLSDKHYEFVEDITKALGVSPSEYLRMLLDKQISQVNRREILENEYKQSYNND